MLGTSIFGVFIIALISIFLFSIFAITMTIIKARKDKRDFKKPPTNDWKKEKEE